MRRVEFYSYHPSTLILLAFFTLVRLINHRGEMFFSINGEIKKIFFAEGFVERIIFVLFW